MVLVKAENKKTGETFLIPNTADAVKAIINYSCVDEDCARAWAADIVGTLQINDSFQYPDTIDETWVSFEKVLVRSNWATRLLGKLIFKLSNF